MRRSTIGGVPMAPWGCGASRRRRSADRRIFEQSVTQLSQLLMKRASTRVKTVLYLYGLIVYCMCIVYQCAQLYRRPRNFTSNFTPVSKLRTSISLKSTFVSPRTQVAHMYRAVRRTQLYDVQYDVDGRVSSEYAVSAISKTQNAMHGTHR